ncbi:MAG: 23S rRNA (adenine(2503)-C(2))-methyltransferase RlmN [Planctomycetota bacterium]|nr:23S rRNA (adenine(2503)-C(2))-methyltransferase RlmN [Planctomycetota bacterium]
MKTEHFYDLSLPRLKELVAHLGHKPFRAKQLWHHAYEHRSWGFSEATDLPDKLVADLSEKVPLKTAKIIKRLDSSDGDTSKVLLDMSGDSVEAVSIAAPSRRTACISSQVGCDLGCRFCASALGGKVRDLSSAEILEQFVAVNSLENDSLTHVVMMGMGEPLLNYEQVVRALKMLVCPEHFGLSRRRITLSTVGVVQGIDALAGERLGINLAISLHASSQEQRVRIVPSAAKWHFDDIIRAAERYHSETGRQVTFEYCLLGRLNDSPEDAEKLGEQLSGKGFAVNVIPYNPVSGRDYERPAAQSTEKFAQVLREHVSAVMIRREKGTDIAAACGQLRADKGGECASQK